MITMSKTKGELERGRKDTEGIHTEIFTIGNTNAAFERSNVDVKRYGILILVQIPTRLFMM